jgi:hypothetical protein
MGFTRALALAGCVDYQWVEQEDLWRGQEVHKLIEYRLKGTLDRATVPDDRKGYLDALEKFLRETCYIPIQVEQYVKNVELRVRGRVDTAGLMRGRRIVIDFKTGAINPAVALQLCLGGFCLDPNKWWERSAVLLRSNGQYSMKNFPLKTWYSDLQTALGAVRIAQWKLVNGLA